MEMRIYPFLEKSWFPAVKISEKLDYSFLQQ